jgi:protein SMG7
VAEAFGAGASNSPAPGSAGAKAFPTLPWEYFYKPPANPALGNSETNGIAASWGANGGRFSRPTSSGNAAQLGAGPATGNPLVRHMHQWHDSQEQISYAEREAEMLRSLHLGSDRASQPQQGYGTRGAWPNAPAEGSTSALGMASHLPQQNTWAPPPSPWRTTYGQNAANTTGGVSNTPFSTLNFSANTSSVPPVNSPWGLPAAANRFSATQSPSSPHHPGTAYASGAIPSPTGGGRYATEYATGMAGGGQPSHAFANAWPDTRQPRTGPTQPPLGLDIWGDPIRQQPAAVGETADGKSAVQQGMPKR